MFQNSSKDHTDSLPLGQMGKLKKEMAVLRVKVKERMAEKRSRPPVTPIITPRYDDEYFHGMEWLDSLAGEKKGAALLDSPLMGV
ncbi:MAG: hypothetical protein FWD79_11175 [Desulfobulbus sp.]|nr:hypothetical protein [Desulfobulbus sp.]